MKGKTATMHVLKQHVTIDGTTDGPALGPTIFCQCYTRRTTNQGGCWYRITCHYCVNKMLVRCFGETQGSWTDRGRLEETSEKLFPSTQLVGKKLWRRSGQHHWPNIRAASMRRPGVSGLFPGAERSTTRLVVGYRFIIPAWILCSIATGRW